MEKLNSPDDSDVVLTLGGKPDESKVTLRIFGDELIPDKITVKLKSQPTEAYKKGDFVTNTVRSRIIKTGTWFLNSEKSDKKNLEEQISEIFEKTTQDLKVWKELSAKFEMDIYYGAWIKTWNRDIWLSAKILKEIADRELNFGAAIYCDCSDDFDEAYSKLETPAETIQ